MDYIPQVSPQMESQKKEDELLFESRPAAKHTHNSRSNPDLSFGFRFINFSEAIYFAK